jgi:hypothetical protein
MDRTCPKCDGTMEAGVATAYGLLFGGVIPKEEPRLLFVVPGTTTSLNLLVAFKQGLEDELANRGYLIVGLRCAKCGFLEFYAKQKTPV